MHFKRKVSSVAYSLSNPNSAGVIFSKSRACLRASCWTCLKLVESGDSCEKAGKVNRAIVKRQGIRLSLSQWKCARFFIVVAIILLVDGVVWWEYSKIWGEIQEKK